MMFFKYILYTIQVERGSRISNLRGTGTSILEFSASDCFKLVGTNWTGFPKCSVYLGSISHVKNYRQLIIVRIGGFFLLLLVKLSVTLPVHFHSRSTLNQILEPYPLSDPLLYLLSCPPTPFSAPLTERVVNRNLKSVKFSSSFTTAVKHYMYFSILIFND